MPREIDHGMATNDSATILYGLAEWDSTSVQPNTKLVGGTFTFAGVTSPLQHHALSKVLRLSVYMHLSLMLEQHLLSNSGVAITFPAPKPRVSISTEPSPAPQQNSQTPESVSSRSSRRQNNILPGILSFFSKKNSLHRSHSIASTHRSGMSLDLSAPDSAPASAIPRLSEDGGSRLRRFSFMGDPRTSFFRPSSPTTPPAVEPIPLPFTSVLAMLNTASPSLSSSAGIRVPPPRLIADLAEREQLAPGRRLKGDEKAGLSSILGWDPRERDRETRGKALCGSRGFARMQELSALVSRHVPASREDQDGECSQPVFATCDQPKWTTYRHYSRHDVDQSLGDSVRSLAASAADPCQKPGCSWKQGDHVMRLVHGGMRVDVKVQESTGDRDEIESWLSCSICYSRSEKTEMNDGAQLYSFGKFIELLIYSPALCRPTPFLCIHTTPSKDDKEILPISRLYIVRHFQVQNRTVSFSLSMIDDIFEVRVPRLQITRKFGDKLGKHDSQSTTTSVMVNDADDEKRTLRREIKAWWEGIADHMDQLETSLMGSTLVGFRKALPRLPSVDDAYDDSASEAETEDELDALTPRTNKPYPITGLPPSAPTTPQISRAAQEYFPDSVPSFSRAASDPVPLPASALIAPGADPIEVLGTMRQTFHRTEQDLYSKLGTTPVSSLNDVRRTFLGAARGAEKRLMAWQTKHIPGRGKRKVQPKIQSVEPEWWNRTCHVAPGCDVIIREDDWGSIIAFAMSTADYRQELASMYYIKNNSTSAAAAAAAAALNPPIIAPSSSSSSSFFSAKLFASHHLAEPDPDVEGTVWYEPEEYSAVISRKEHPRDATSLLSLREVLRQKSPTLDGASLVNTVIPGGSRFGSLGSAATKGSSSVSKASGSSLAPPSAWSKPDVPQITRHEAGGEVIPLDSETAGKILQEIDAASVSDGHSTSSSRPGSSMSGSFLAFGDTHIRRGKAASIISVDSDHTIGGKEDKERDRDQDERTEPQVDLSTASPSTFTNTLTNGLSSAMRYMLKNSEIPRPSIFSKNHHGLLAPADAFAIDERPHIKYDWTVGKRLKFSCTVYYAKQFDSLRKRCGIEDAFVKSLSRSANWAAEGGKSKSNFWKTSDDRFIIKTLVNAWNVADLQVLIELAPSYFKYMDATASKATVLAKLIGFYTIEIRNLETGNVQSKADLLVMENLFYQQTVDKTFDLKGIQGRKVKSTGSKTLFDGEWIEGQQRTLTLVQPHSKAVLREAIRSDAEFLARSNIMDYSLLLGVDKERKQIACGLVDTIGSYTFAKTLEYKAKQGLNSGKEVTVIPPTEYQERFVSALDGYFLACPDRWSRPADDRQVIDDPWMLPSVL
ncbi:unnamed protein product [Mycena citricolor]|uniref:PIPK domain-containing protein n=1 Tax=Mycena citricolor TaxID=2018698 RepID=A0AAD2HD77_9AGAR|nr:unnamed protein product [Mycena citricolor]